MTTVRQSPSPSKTADAERPLISRSTIVILLSYQTGMILGNGIPTSISSLLFVAVSVSVISYLGYTLFRLEGQKKKLSRKHNRIARQVDRRIRTHIIDQPASEQKAPLQPRLRSVADFVPVVSEWA